MNTIKESRRSIEAIALEKSNLWNEAFDKGYELGKNDVIKESRRSIEAMSALERSRLWNEAFDKGYDAGKKDLMREINRIKYRRRQTNALQ